MDLTCSLPEHFIIQTNTLIVFFQVCNYRSSFFTDVDTHFRTVHENTKDLLCPFCLKVLKSGHVYMQHYMKHQVRGLVILGTFLLLNVQQSMINKYVDWVIFD